MDNRNPKRLRGDYKNYMGDALEKVPRRTLRAKLPGHRICPASADLPGPSQRHEIERFDNSGHWMENHEETIYENDDNHNTDNCSFPISTDYDDFSASSDSENDDAKMFEECPASNFHSNFSKHQGNPLYNGAKISQSESLLLVFSFITRHKLSNSCSEDLLTLLLHHVPSVSNFPSSLYKFKKMLGFDYSSSEVQFYCPTCSSCIGDNPEIICQTCDTTWLKRSLLNSGNFFLSFNLKQIFEKLLKIEEVNLGVETTLKKRLEKSNVYEDIYSGKKYQELRLEDNDLTVTVNSDGVPVFKSSKFSLWPLLLSLNELPYPLRRKYTLIGGLWFGPTKPNFDSFFDPFVTQCKMLSTCGLKWSTGSQLISSKIYFPVFVADSVARCVIQGLVQFNGAYGCPWCLSKGESWKNPENEKSRKWVYPPLKKKEMIKRTKESFVAHLQEYAAMMESGVKVKSVSGVKSASRLLLLEKFDIVNGFTFDYMHTALIGVAKYFLTAWMEHTGEEYYIGHKTDEIDHKLLRCLVPFDTQRAVRSVSNRGFWKANEFKTWICLVSIVLDGILDDKYLQHFTLFSGSILLLCSDNLEMDCTDKVEKNLFNFVRKTRALYGLGFCTSNVHLLLHAAECVRNWGPLYAYSAFQFEHSNGILLNSFHGTQHVPEQIAKNVQELSHARMLDENSFENFEAGKFYFSMLENKKGVKFSTKIGSVTFLGKPKTYHFSPVHKAMLANMTIVCGDGQKFDKVILHGKMYNVYSKNTQRRCNSVVSVKNRIYLVKSFVVVRNDQQDIGLAIVCRLKTKRIIGFPLGHLVTKVFNCSKFVFVSDIERLKYICLQNDHGEPTQVVQLPNLVELE